MSFSSLKKSAPRRRAFRLVLLTTLFALSAAVLQAGAEAVPVKRDTADSDRPGIVSDTRASAAALATAFNPIKITMSPIPFETIRPDGFIVREVVVQNDSSAPATVSIRMRFTDRDYSQVLSRSVGTTRQVPAHSRQTIPLFVPASCIQRYFHSSDYFNSADPQIYVNGFPYRPVPTGFMDGENTDSSILPLPSSFAGQESLAEFLAMSITRKYDSPFVNEGNRFTSGRRDDVEIAISGSDTIQWPSIPQFYQSQPIIFRKSTDQFSPDAERAIREAVMLGSTEVLLMMPGSPWPEWASHPAIPGLPVFARGFGQSIVLNASDISGLAQAASPAGGPQDNPDDKRVFASAFAQEEWNRATAREAQANSAQQMAASNSALESILRETHIRAFNPALLLLPLPHVDIPTIPFVLVILALLAYIVVVGPVNYFRLVRKKKSILLLLLTVPIISLAFVAIVIVFVGLVEGWSSRASAVGVTFLDQKESMAYTRAAVSLYAPVPVRSLTFDTADSVTFSRTKSIDITLGRDQVITGANRARVPLSYAISRAEKHLEQLKVVHDASGVSVVNGLGVPLNKLMVKTDDGGIWVASGVVAPGEAVRLDKSDVEVPTKQEAEQKLTKVLEKYRDLDHTYYTSTTSKETFTDTVSFPFNPLLTAASALLLEKPAGASLEKMGEVISVSRYGSEANHIAQPDLPAAKDYFENTPGAIEAVLPSGMYMAETNRPLFYSPGCKPVSFRARHIVFGTFSAQEATNEN